eukprot:CAMPEP_0185788438 /NCGR_PEP_ID=MMETSP1174-20130828/146064_1 /TAXON_ID=35687 /ORGANISM="Dictyocha speculum, Strain CCMP1381" /LENGTH=50 /DNA_ID=CAMNT_0028482125 /DNA_START=13 /DNA_END=161 /DNA_ORIENTATION=+
MIALAEARMLWPHRPIGLVVSLGTGDSEPIEWPPAPPSLNQDQDDDSSAL